MELIMRILGRLLPVAIGIPLILAGPLAARAQGVPIKLDIKSSDVVDIARLLVEEIDKGAAYIKSANAKNVRDATVHIAENLNAIAAVKVEITRAWSEYKEQIGKVGPNTPSDERIRIDTVFSDKLGNANKQFSADLDSLRRNISILDPDWTKKNITTEAAIMDALVARGSTESALDHLYTDLVGSSGQVTFEHRVSGAEDLFARQSREAAELKTLAERITATLG